MQHFTQSTNYRGIVLCSVPAAAHRSDVSPDVKSSQRMTAEGPAVVVLWGFLFLLRVTPDLIKVLTTVIKLEPSVCSLARLTYRGLIVRTAFHLLGHKPLRV